MRRSDKPHSHPGRSDFEQRPDSHRERSLPQRQLVQRHPKRITAAIAALLLGGAGGSLRRRHRWRPTPPTCRYAHGDGSRAAAARASPDSTLWTPHSFELYRTRRHPRQRHRRDPAQTLGVVDPAAAAFLRRRPGRAQALLGRAGRNVSRSRPATGRTLLKLTRALDAADDGRHASSALSSRRPRQRLCRHSLETAPLAASTRLASGTIRIVAVCRHRRGPHPDAVATQLAEIFSGDIDFHRALRKGDRFSVVYETLEADGEPPARRPRAERRVRQHRQDLPGHVVPGPGQRQGRATTTCDGQSLRRAFLASPDGVLARDQRLRDALPPASCKPWRAHLGVDYGAPTGTPVRSVGDGVVEFAGVQNGYGNVVMIKHHNNQRDRLRAPEPHRRAQGPARRARATTSAPSAPPAGPPARTCTSSSASTASTRTR